MIEKRAKPFVKWAGGKSQILEEIKSVFPKELGSEINKYVEPFVGGGAVLFEILEKYNLKEYHINDINGELMNAYKIVKENVDALIDILFQLEKSYLSKDINSRKEFYYEIRNNYNKSLTDESFDETLKAAYFIFLNKTCFNGLYRVNKNGFFNVPAGTYKNPLICDSQNLRNVSEALQKVNILTGDFSETRNVIDSNTLVYFDPPYRPLSNTSAFTSYSKSNFNDDNQIELAQYAREMSDRGAKIILSNSDPKNSNPNDCFFDELYEDFQVERIYAKRMINSNANNRGKITELLITNFDRRG